MKASQQVLKLEESNKALEELIGEMLATIHVNRARGTLTSVDEDSFTQIIEAWKRRRTERDGLGVRSKCTLEENINRAAAELPEGWIIEINVEAGAGWVTLYDGCGNSVDVSGDRTINEQVSEAISYAREHS